MLFLRLKSIKFNLLHICECLYIFISSDSCWIMICSTIGTENRYLKVIKPLFIQDPMKKLLIRTYNNVLSFIKKREWEQFYLKYKLNKFIIIFPSTTLSNIFIWRTIFYRSHKKNLEALPTPINLLKNFLFTWYWNLWFIFYWIGFLIK